VYSYKDYCGGQARHGAEACDKALKDMEYGSELQAASVGGGDYMGYLRAPPGRQQNV